jgi:hypothetical protein
MMGYDGICNLLPTYKQSTPERAYRPQYPRINPDRTLPCRSQ